MIDVIELTDHTVMQTAAQCLNSLEIADEVSKVRSCMEQLTAHAQSVLKLILHEGLSHQEVSTSLCIAFGSVKSFARRGLLALRDCVTRPLTSFAAGGTIMKPSNESNSKNSWQICLGELTEDELRQLGSATDSASAGTVKDLERIATLAALAGADPSETLPDQLRQTITATAERSYRLVAQRRMRCRTGRQASRGRCARSHRVAGLPGRYRHGTKSLAKHSVRWQPRSHATVADGVSAGPHSNRLDGRQDSVTRESYG